MYEEVKLCTDPHSENYGFAIAPEEPTGLMGRKLCPVNNRSFDPGAETVVYREFSNETNRVLAPEICWEVRQKVVSIPVGFRSGDAKAQAAAYRSIEERIDQIIAFGDQDNFLLGMLNQPRAISCIAPDGKPFSSKWAEKSDSEILNDLNLMAKKVTRANTLLLPVEQRKKIVGSIEQRFLDQNPSIIAIEAWYRCKGAGPNGTDRAMLYYCHPKMIEMIIPLEAETLPAQPGGLTPVHARVSGVALHETGSVCYMDGI